MLLACARLWRRSVLVVVLAGLAFSAAGAAAEIPFEDPAAFPDAAYPLLEKARVVWFGEQHGTNEVPRLLLGLARLIARHEGAPPVIALEIPAGNQPAIDAYLRTGDEDILRASAFFSMKTRDGRSSQAMVRLLAALRAEKMLRVVCFDPFDTASAQDRDTKMAGLLADAAERFSPARLLVLSGNIHSRVNVGTSWDAAYRPAAFELKRKIDSLLSFDLAYAGGKTWSLTDAGAGEHSVGERPWAGRPPFSISVGSAPPGADGVIFARTLTPSPPWPP